MDEHGLVRWIWREV